MSQIGYVMPTSWDNAQSVAGKKYTCSYCDLLVGPNFGWYKKPNAAWVILICPNCEKPTFFEGNTQHPSVMLGDSVQGITDKEVETLFVEARLCASVSAFTSCVMACRKILMNVAVHRKAEKKNQTFQDYVNYLDAQGYIPPDGKPWVDEIRKRGNTANHEINLMTNDDAQLILDFTTMLLRFVYEVPFKMKPKTLAQPVVKTTTTSPIVTGNPLP